MSKSFKELLGPLFGFVVLVVLILVFVENKRTAPEVFERKEEKQRIELTARAEMHKTETVNKFVQIISEKRLIYFKSNEASELIANARKGDVFELMDENGAWYDINFFSGERRSVRKEDAEVIEFTPLLPDEEILKKIWDENLEAERKSTVEAGKKYPPDKDLYRNIDYNRILSDKYKLGIFHKYNINPANYIGIINYGFEKNWHLMKND